MKFVKIPGKNYEMSVYLTTQGDWCEIMPNNPSYFHGINKPVEQVSWDDTQRFIKKLNDKKDGYTYKLPTEVEWEYCCRADCGGDYCFGDNVELLKDYAWYRDNSGNRTHSVGEKLPNDFGLYDMHGNVWEWTDSLYSPNSSDRVLRGGSWGDDARNLRSSDRYNYGPGGAGSDIGFRLVRTPSNALLSNTFTIERKRKVA